MNANAPGSGHGYYGKFRGTVKDNRDPDHRGRLTLLVPDVLGDVVSSWAEACAPLAGPTGQAMGAYLVPPVGAGVWVEFEHGNPDYPVWMGCRWDTETDVPQQARDGQTAETNIVIQSKQQQILVISDMAASENDGGILLKSAGGATIRVNDSGIYISNGKGASIKLVGKDVKINDDALVVS